MKDKENIGHIQDATIYDTLIGTIRTVSYTHLTLPTTSRV